MVSDPIVGEVLRVNDTPATLWSGLAGEGRICALAYNDLALVLGQHADDEGKMFIKVLTRAGIGWVHPSYLALGFGSDGL